MNLDLARTISLWLRNLDEVNRRKKTNWFFVCFLFGLQSTSTISASPQQQQFLASAAALISRSITPNQSSSPLFTRSLTPSQSMSTATRPSSVGQPQVGVSVSAPSNLNLLQLQQSQQITQQVGDMHRCNDASVKMCLLKFLKT